MVTVKENGEEKIVEMDMSRTVTLERMRRLWDRLEHLTGLHFPVISVEHKIICLSGGRAETEEKQQDKTYRYNKVEDCLIVFDRGVPVYENKAGAVCTDTDKLAEKYW